MQRLVTAIALVLVTACASTAKLPPGQRIGADIAPRESVRFSVVDAEPAKFTDHEVLVEGTIKAVCQNMGCWMQLEDAGHTAVVRWETGCGGKYAFPKDAAGKRVLVQGKFEPKKLDVDAAEHIEQESRGTVKIPRDGYEFHASGVIVLDATK